CGYFPARGDVIAFGLVPALLATLIPPSWQRWPAGWAWLASACAWSVLGTVGVLVTAALMSAFAGAGIVYWGVVVAYVALSALTVVAFAGFRRQADLDVELTGILARQEVRASRLMHRIDYERRELGLVLHGAVQASLTRAALSLERWGAGGEARDLDALPEVIEEVRRALDFAVGALDIRPPAWGGLEEVLRDRLRLWEGAVTCEWTVDAEVGQVADAMLAHRIGDVVGEAVTNAVRHGQAERVGVDVGLEGDWVLVRVRDDGVGPVGSRHPGAGLGHLGPVGIAWSLERDGPETLLTVRLPAIGGRVMETEQPAGAATAWA
ncbi:MAG: sensor histidine kinase, partial [bacterium]